MTTHHTNTFKPGDVVHHPKHGRGIVQDFGSGIVEWVADSDYLDLANVDDDLRRLVVIDPEETIPEPAVEAFRKAWHEADELGVEGSRVRVGIKALLDEILDPTVPKPDEPTGAGAVVADRDGDLWVRADLEDPQAWVRIGDTVWLEYSRINAVHVLSEGINPADLPQ